MSAKFNLMDEPWILVIDENAKMAELSLKQVLLKAHEYKSLAGENPAQDVAILRLLIAVVHTIFYRMDENGNDSELEDEEEALERWGELWMKRDGGLPQGPVKEYLDEWHERFWLFHDEYPFYQVPEAENRGTLYDASKLNGQILQSSNKARIFANRVGEERDRLTFAEASRWLIYLQGFDDSSAKPTKEYKRSEKLEKIEINKLCWLGNLGLVYSVGCTLLETILLNLMFLKDGELYKQPSPCWEVKPKFNERVLVQPDNIPELFTLQCRRVFLVRDDKDHVTGYREYVGELLKGEDAFAEPMTLWKKKDNHCFPQKHDPSKKLWRDFSSLVVETKSSRPPGIICWLQRIREIIECDGFCGIIRFVATSVDYNKKGSSVEDIISDSLSFHFLLLSNLEKTWQKLIKDQIILCDDVAELLARFAGSIALASGKRELEKSKPITSPKCMHDAKLAKEQFYFRVDSAFRRWLLRPQVEQESVEREQICADWNKTVIDIAFEIGNEFAKKASLSALTGRWIGGDNEPKSVYYSASRAYNEFKFELSKFKKKGE